MKIYLDFDGTIVAHTYPQIGKHNKGWAKTIDKLHAAGHEIILNTYRADLNDGTLQAAVDYLVSYGKFGLISEVLMRKQQPEAWDWEKHQKDQAIYLDDICPGIPLRPGKGTELPMVDWKKVRKELKVHGLFQLQDKKTDDQN